MFVFCFGCVSFTIFLGLPATLSSVLLSFVFGMLRVLWLWAVVGGLFSMSWFYVGEGRSQ